MKLCRRSGLTPWDDDQGVASSWPHDNPVCRAGHGGAMRARSAPLVLSWGKDLFPQGMAFAVIPPVLCHGRTAFHQVRCLRAFQGSHTGGERVSKEPTTSMWANGNSMGLKNKSLEACLETGIDAVEAQWQHLLPPVPVVRTNKGKWAEATELQLLLSSFYSYPNVPRVSVFSTWFYRHNFSLTLAFTYM